MLTRLIAPVLSFTAEEIWAVQHPGSEDSVFLHAYYSMPPVQGAEALKARWAGLREVRAIVSKQLEEARSAGKIGSSLQAEVLLTTSGAELPLLRSFEDDLRFVFITSQAKVAESVDVSGIDVKVVASAHAKCERCWHYRADVGSSAEHPTICGRCVSNLFGSGEKRFHA